MKCVFSQFAHNKWILIGLFPVDLAMLQAFVPTGEHLMVRLKASPRPLWDFCCSCSPDMITPELLYCSTKHVSKHIRLRWRSNRIWIRTMFQIRCLYAQQPQECSRLHVNILKKPEMCAARHVVLVLFWQKLSHPRKWTLFPSLSHCLALFCFWLFWWQHSLSFTRSTMEHVKETRWITPHALKRWLLTPNMSILWLRWGINCCLHGKVLQYSNRCLFLWEPGRMWWERRQFCCCWS